MPFGDHSNARQQFCPKEEYSLNETAIRLRRLALAMAQRALHRKGYVTHKSGAGVEYIFPFSRCRRSIQNGQPMNDGRVYVKGKRGNLVFSHKVDRDGNRLAA